MKRGLILLFAVGCEGIGAEPVGRKCDLGFVPSPTEVVVSEPALDCAAGACLRVPLGHDPAEPEGTAGLCTAACASDDDCAAVADTPCATGFTCGVPPGAVVGGGCCQHLCVCRDYVELDATGHLPEPLACDATDATNTCCNLEGRAGNPRYPQCAR